MITINLSPVRSNEVLVITKLGEVLTINGVAYDLSVIPNGGSIVDQGLPFIGDIDKDINGNATLTLLYPHGASPTQEQAFPLPIVNPKDGKVLLP